MKSVRKLSVCISTLFVLTLAVASCPIEKEPLGIISGTSDVTLDGESITIPNVRIPNKKPVVGDELNAEVNLSGEGAILYAWRLGKGMLSNQTERTLKVRPEYYDSTLAVIGYKEDYIGAIVSNPTDKVVLEKDPPNEVENLTLNLVGLPFVRSTLTAKYDYKDDSTNINEINEFINDAVFIWWRLGEKPDTTADEDGKVNLGADPKADNYVLTRDDLDQYIAVWAVSAKQSAVMKSGWIGPIMKGVKVDVRIDTRVPELPRDGEYQFTATVSNPDHIGLAPVGWTVIPKEAGKFDENVLGLLRINEDADLGQIKVRADLYLDIPGLEELSLTNDETAVTVMETPKILVDPTYKPDANDKGIVAIPKGGSQPFTVEQLEQAASKTVLWSIESGDEYVNHEWSNIYPDAYTIYLTRDAEASQYVTIRATAIGTPKDYKDDESKRDSWWSEGKIFISAEVDGSFTISFDDLTDITDSEIDMGDLSVLNEGGMKLDVDTDQIDDIRWIYDGVILPEWEHSFNFTFDRKLHQNRVGIHKVTVEILTGGVWFSRTLTITVTY